MGSSTTKLKKPGTLADYLKQLTPAQRKIARELKSLIEATVPKAECRIKWGYPWWELDSDDICYIAGVADRINFGFPQGAQLEDPASLLEGTGKGMRHIKVRDLADIKKTKFTVLLRQAARLARSTT